ncbi:hypothetical protein PPERSA_11773 [Pseudocohnilembus persalinus]|uniref:Uncharacterized protein n=1 Tax=Pseudocohnilembus persalinus TaxID=266149 RepID=A0A0V0QGK2_PSEPJ|nr:hypothetical protein PPERSA_11773 [Pseudocohnilembus persalinus]|eukprot:KRX01326.1 hypothetical protein PPERSA_11773 [Pseudocohnilembus persalinus]
MSIAHPINIVYQQKHMHFSQQPQQQQKQFTENSQTQQQNAQLQSNNQNKSLIQNKGGIQLANIQQGKNNTNGISIPAHKRSQTINFSPEKKNVQQGTQEKEDQSFNINQNVNLDKNQNQNLNQSLNQSQTNNNQAQKTLTTQNNQTQGSQNSSIQYKQVKNLSSSHYIPSQKTVVSQKPIIINPSTWNQNKSQNINNSSIDNKNNIQTSNSIVYSKNPQIVQPYQQYQYTKPIQQYTIINGQKFIVQPQQQNIQQQQIQQQQIQRPLSSQNAKNTLVSSQQFQGSPKVQQNQNNQFVRSFSVHSQQQDNQKQNDQIRDSQVSFCGKNQKSFTQDEQENEQNNDTYDRIFLDKKNISPKMERISKKMSSYDINNLSDTLVSPLNAFLKSRNPTLKVETDESYFAQNPIKSDLISSKHLYKNQRQSNDYNQIFQRKKQPSQKLSPLNSQKSLSLKQSLLNSPVIKSKEDNIKIKQSVVVPVPEELKSSLNQENLVIEHSPIKIDSQQNYNQNQNINFNQNQNEQNNKMQSQLSPNQKRVQKIQEQFYQDKQKEILQLPPKYGQKQKFRIEEFSNDEIFERCKHQLQKLYEIHQEPFWFQKYCFECKNWFFHEPKNNKYQKITGLQDPTVEDIPFL